MNNKIHPIAKYKDLRNESLFRKFGTQFAYGHREILLNYAEIDNTAMLMGILQHGVGPTFTLYSDWPTPRGKLLTRTPLWVYSQKTAVDLRAQGIRDVRAIGSPWIYSKILDKVQNLQLTSRSKYLIFPRHDADSFVSKSTIDEIRAKIKIWKSKTGTDEIQICLYWTEFSDVIWQEAARQEEVILRCAGVPGSSPLWSQSSSRINFYKNLRDIINTSTHCIFESFTSAIFYANDLEKKVGIFTSETEKRETSRQTFFQEEYTWLYNNLSDIFDTCETNPTLDVITRELLGYDSILSPGELKAVLHFKSGLVPSH